MDLNVSAPASMEETVAKPMGESVEATILVVEDEPLVLTFLGAVLEDFGYQVLEAKSAEQALEIWGNQPRPIDLVLTDIFMPGMNGADLARVLSARQPGIKIVYTSGAPRHRVDALVDSKDSIHFIPKPYHLPLLEEILKKAMKD